MIYTYCASFYDVNNKYFSIYNKRLTRLSSSYCILGSTRVLLLLFLYNLWIKKKATPVIECCGADIVLLLFVTTYTAEVQIEFSRPFILVNAYFYVHSSAKARRMVM